MPCHRAVRVRLIYVTVRRLHFKLIKAACAKAICGHKALKNAAIGYAVANASDDLKAVADRITVSNEEHAIAKIIEDLARGI